MQLTRPLAAAALVTSAFLGGSADAACVGTANTATACHSRQPAVVYEDCVYTGGSTCTPVQVVAPLCLYGHILGAQYQTVWC